MPGKQSPEQTVNHLRLCEPGERGCFRRKLLEGWVRSGKGGVLSPLGKSWMVSQASDTPVGQGACQEKEKGWQRSVFGGGWTPCLTRWEGGVQKLFRLKMLGDDVLGRQRVILGAPWWIEGCLCSSEWLYTCAALIGLKEG